MYRISDVEKVVIEVVSEFADVSQIARTDPIKIFRLDDLSFMDLILAIEIEFDIEILDDEIEALAAGDVGNVINLVKEKLSEKS